MYSAPPRASQNREMFVVAPSSCGVQSVCRFPRMCRRFNSNTHPIADDRMSNGDDRAQAEGNENPGPEAAILGRTRVRRDHRRRRCWRVPRKR